MTDTGSWLLDVSRLLARLHHGSPRGIDRVLLSYARRFVGRGDARFCAWAQGAWHLVPTPWVHASCDLLERRWEHGGAASIGSRTAQHALRVTTRFRGIREPMIAALGEPLRASAFAGARRVTYVNVSHKELHRLGELRAALRPRDVEIVVMLHDLMPIQRPDEFPAPLQRDFRAGLEATRIHADLVVTNSHATTADVERHWSSPRRGCAPPIVTLGLAADGPRGARPLPEPSTPHFVHVGAIEPRKNIQLLLSVWERMADEGGAVPRLYLVGDPRSDALVGRARALAPHVSIRRDAGDAEVRLLLRTARALLAPSLAEGFGLPVAEALGLSTPVICSDIPSLREASQGLAEHVRSQDRDEWTSVIQGYVSPGSLPRSAQLARLKRFRPIRWDTHFRTLEATLAEQRSGAVTRRAPVSRFATRGASS